MENTDEKAKYRNRIIKIIKAYETFCDKSKFTDDEKKVIHDYNIQTERLWVDNGLDKTDHNFTDDKGSKLEFNYELIASFGKQDLIDFIVHNIRQLSSGKSLGEQTLTV
jgi:hypothetical protein